MGWDPLEDIKKGLKKVGNFIGDVVGGLLGIEDIGDQEDPGFTLNKQSNIANIPVVYGTRKVGGTRVFMTTSGTDNRFLYIVLVLAEGEVHAIDEVYVNDVPSGDAQYNGRISITRYTGTDTQVADPTLIAANIGWTSAHTLSGLAYIVAEIDYDPDALSGVPNIQAVVRGRKVYDPRTTLTLHSDNPALCLRDYLLNDRFGKGLTTSQIDETAFEAAADKCDELVSEFSGEPTDTPIFRCNAVIDTANTLFANVKTFLAGMRGVMPYTEGKYGLIVEDDIASSFDFGVENMTSEMSLSSRGKNKRYNRVSVKFTNPDANWQPDTVTWPDPNSAQYATFFAEDNDIDLSKSVTLNTCTSIYQARDMARMLCLSSRNQSLNVSFDATSEALECAVGDVVTVTHPTPGWDHKEFRITGLKLMDDGEVAVSAQEHDASIYPWIAEGEADPVAEPFVPNPRFVEPPTNLSVVAEVDLNDSGGVVSYISVTWDESVDRTVSHYEIEYTRDSGDSIVFTAPGLYARIYAPENGVDYDVSVRAVNGIGARSASATHATVTSGADTTAPTVPTDLSVTGELTSFGLTWTRPTDKDFAGVEIWENDTDNSGTATKVHEIGPGTGTNAYGYSYNVTKYFWIKVFDHSGNVSGFSNSDSATTAEDVIQAESELTSFIPLGGAWQTISSVVVDGESEDATLVGQTGITYNNPADLNWVQIRLYRDEDTTVLSGPITISGDEVIHSIRKTVNYTGSATYRLQVYIDVDPFTTGPYITNVHNRISYLGLPR